MNILETDRRAVADKRAEAASLEMKARRLHREADEIEIALFVRVGMQFQPLHIVNHVMRAQLSRR